MTINEDNGSVTLSEICASVPSSLCRSQFLQTPEFSGASVLVRNEPWCSYLLRNIPQPDTELSVTFQFYGEQLFSLHLSHGAVRFGTSWADWSEERELARKAFHERWLTHELRLRLGAYPWGEISSDYDARGGSSLITIRYAAGISYWKQRNH